MPGTDVYRSFGDAYLEATTAMRERFEQRVVEGSSWRTGLASALADLADGVLQDPEEARLTVTDVRYGTRDMLELCDTDRQETIESLARGWEHHHGGDAPVLHMEFLCGAISHVIAMAIERDGIGALRERLVALVAFAGDEQT